MVQPAFVVPKPARTPVINLRWQEESPTWHIIPSRRVEPLRTVPKAAPPTPRTSFGIESVLPPNDPSRSSGRIWLKNKRGQRPVLYARKEENDDGKRSGDLLESVLTLLASPLPTLGSDTIPLYYPLIVISSALLLPRGTAVLFALFFGSFWYLGRTIVGEEEEDDRFNEEGVLDVLSVNEISNLIALAGGFASAALLSPWGLINERNIEGWVGITPAILLALVGLLAFPSAVGKGEQMKSESGGNRVEENFQNVGDETGKDVLENGDNNEYFSSSRTLMDMWDEKFKESIGGRKNNTDS